MAMTSTQPNWNDFAQEAIFAKIQEALMIATKSRAVVVGDFVKQLVRREANPKCELDYSNIELWIPIGSPRPIMESINKTLKDADLESDGYHPPSSSFKYNLYVFGTKVARFSFITTAKFPFEDLDVNYLCVYGHDYETSKWLYSTPNNMDVDVLKQNVIAKKARIMPTYCQMLVNLVPVSPKYQQLSRQIVTQNLKGWKIFYKTYLWFPSVDSETNPDQGLGHWLRQRLAADAPPVDSPAPIEPQTEPLPSARDQALTE